MSDKVFSTMPSIGIPSTRLSIDLHHHGSMMFGKLIPLDALPILPGDHIRTDVYGIIRMGTPIAPIMDDIEANLYSMFVPARLVFNKFEQWFTAGNENFASGAPIQLNNFTELPKYSVYEGVQAGSMADYLGKPVTVRDTNKLATYGFVNSLKERAYFKAWADWFIPGQLVTAQVRDIAGNTAGVGTTVINGVSRTYFAGQLSDLLSVCKNYDYFTAATISPQYASAAVSIPLASSSALVYVEDSNAAAGDSMSVAVGSPYAANTFRVQSTITHSDNSTAQSDLLVDLSNATMTTINALRTAFSIQRYAERSNMGNRFFEVLQAHYGVTSPDARLQRTEYIGHKKFLINTDEVISTAGYQAGTSTTVGQPGAISRTGFNYYLGHKSFVEPGYLLTMISTRQSYHTYKQGLMREDCLLTKFQMFSPEFQNLGDQAVLNKEVYLQGNAADELPFGFQSHWSEYRFRPNRSSGLLNVNAPGALDFWTLGDKFTSLPTLTADFLFETRDNLARCLTTGVNGPDFIFDIVVKYTADRQVKAHSIPGLIDHFGTH